MMRGVAAPAASAWGVWELSVWLRAVCVMAACCWLPVAARAESARDFRYDMRIEGVTEDWLRARLENMSELQSQRKHVPESWGELRSRIARDLDIFRKYLRSEGYYDAELNYEIDETEAHAEVKIIIEPGERYHIDHYTVTLTGADHYPPDVRRLLDDNKLVPGQIAVAGAIADLTGRVLAGLPERGYPFADLGPQSIIVDHDAKTVAVDTEIRTGGAARFGKIRVQGQKSVSELYLRRLATFDAGQPYDSRLLEKYRQALVKTGLFSAVTVTPQIPEKGRAETPVFVEVLERVKRSYGGSVGYQTESGFGVEAFWEHRNLFGQQEKLRLSAIVNQMDQGVEAQFEKPNFRRRDQNLVAGAAIKREKTDAYEQYTINAHAGVERAFAKFWKISANGGIDYSRVRDDVQLIKALLVYFPVALAHDSTNDLLNPESGLRLGAGITPFFGVAGRRLSFYRADLSGSIYRPLGSGNRFVAAARFRAASLFGEPTLAIPADKRLYAGGGASIRGFTYQHVGPLDPATGDPVGGRSLFELGLEMRVRIAEHYGVVPFVEGGNVRDASLPKPFSGLRWGAGLGFRYYTSFAPVRIDIATPLNRRPGEPRVQFYISVGQSF